MKTIACVIIISIVLISPTFAQDTTSAAKIDTVLFLQKALMDLQKKIYNEVEYVAPLANKSVGVEFNLARILATAGRDYPSISGTFSLFAVTRSGELAFPYYYQHGTTKQHELFGSGSYDVPVTLVNLDATYRHFLGKHQAGIYFSGGVRYTYINGIEGPDFIIFSVKQSGAESSANRFGAYFGVGYLYFTKSGFYWGTSFIFGRFFGGEKHYQEVILDDGPYIIDMEFLKFGYAF